MSDLGERLARVETALDWVKVALTVLAAVMLGGFSVLFVQLSRLDSKIDTNATALTARIDTIGPRISEEAARTRQELIGIANAISNSITATRQMQQPTPKE